MTFVKKINLKKRASRRSRDYPAYRLANFRTLVKGIPKLFQLKINMQMNLTSLAYGKLISVQGLHETPKSYYK